MKQTFDFKQIGKRMPYRVPNGFFQEMERNVLEAATGKTFRLYALGKICSSRSRVGRCLIGG